MPQIPKFVYRTGTNVDLIAAYYLFFHLLGVVTLTPWIVRSQTWGSVLDSDGQSRVWW